ncbi:hypothetical protein F0L68_15765 [Solihabitans fulvus]|uniref:Uncharacterized protein n=1 Tax=Solihabitans fulvus TaxID=1892852 RepID=A0A5B2XEC8_9PSEU|nr:DUF6319 family protein [Solihabitans fulvus]KAA2261703.1 hypothetical protein F0L68_15765 [Solihabitans fulvus]
MVGPDSLTQEDVQDQQEQQTDDTTQASADVASAAPSSEGSVSAEGAEEPSENGAAKRGRPRKQSTAKKTRTVELTLTVTGTAEGEWQADLVHGTNRVVRGLSISAAAVARAAKELHPDISEGIETVIDAAREQHRSRMEQLEAELEQVKRALAELND